VTPTACPDPAALARFAVGDLDPAAFEQVVGHVEHCPACDTALARLGDPADALVTGLRCPPTATGDVPKALISAALDPHPTRVGKFALHDRLGVGSFGTVYRAVDTELGREVAIKLLRAGRFASPDETERFLREARSAANLAHPGLVTIYEAGRTDDGICYLAEELVRGSSLADRLRNGSFDSRAAAKLVADVADALAVAHAQGVVHRDLKPSNVVLDASGRPHVTDFGLAKLDADDADTMTPDGEVLGTPAYMSPEQARGDSHRVDARSDVYSLGVVLYELLTGERPFRGNRRMLLLQVLHDEPRPPRRLNDKVHRDLETVCLKAMAKTPARRYQSMTELADDLRRHLDGLPVRARPVGRAERFVRWCRRNPVPVGLLVALAVGSAVGLWHLSRLSERLVRSTALEGAAQQAETLEGLNELYSAAVDKAMPAGAVFPHDYATRKGAMPLPATLTIDLGKRLSAGSESGMQVRLYSDYPWRFRTDGGPADDFEWEALRKLRANPDEPVYRFEEFGGRPVLRYAIARRMRENCLNCHNFSPDSMKKDWKVGDVRGVVEIVRPLDRDITRTQAGLRETFVLVAVVAGSLLGLTVIVVWSGRRSRAARSV
jgi:hypothetical protein